MPDTWPVSSANTSSFASGAKSKFEPSGLACVGEYLYVVSDNCRTARINLANDDNHGDAIDYQNMNDVSALINKDLECITAIGDALFLGAEGNSDSPSECPRIYEYYPNPNHKDRLPPGNNNNIGRSWALSDLPHDSDDGGMEAMTFAPDGGHPFANSTGGFNGLFLVASQAVEAIGAIYAYDLSIDGASARQVGSFRTPVLDTAATSELHYSASRDTLFVLYDKAIYQLQELRMTPPAQGDSFGTVTQLFLTEPKSPTGVQLRGIEGLAACGSDLFISIDQKKSEARHNNTCVNRSCSQFDNFVYRYKNYPQH